MDITTASIQAKRYEGIDIIYCLKTFSDKEEGKTPIGVWKNLTKLQHQINAIKYASENPEARFNLAIRNDKVASLDCDSRKTVEAFWKFLHSKGIYTCPHERTSQDHCHFFIILDGKPDNDRHILILKGEGIKGELRFGYGSLTTVEPSQCRDDLEPRKIEQGSPETLLSDCPHILYSELVAWMDSLAPEEVTKVYPEGVVNTVLIKGYELPRYLDCEPREWGQEWFLKSHNIESGKEIVVKIKDKFGKDTEFKFRSKSELEFTVFCYWFSCGWSIDRIKLFFDELKPSHYAHKPQYYLKKYYEDCLSVGCRRSLAGEFLLIEPATLKDVVKRVFLSYAWQFDRIEFFRAIHAIKDDVNSDLTAKPESLIQKPALDMDIWRVVNELEKEGFIKIKNKGYSTKKGIDCSSRIRGHANEYKLGFEIVNARDNENCNRIAKRLVKASE